MLHKKYQSLQFPHSRIKDLKVADVNHATLLKNSVKYMQAKIRNFEYKLFSMQSVSEQVLWLFILAIPIACIAWTVTHEEVFREPREYCIERSKAGKSMLHRKFFYLFTCEYCFSHYVTLFMLFITEYKLLYADWRGYLIAGFALVWVANLYMSLHFWLRQAIVKEKTEIHSLESKTDN